MAKIYDTLLGEYIQNPGARGLGLDKLAKEKFRYEMKSYDSLTDKGKITFDKVDLATAAKYSGEDVYMTARIFQQQKKSENKNFVLEKIEIPLLEILKKIELTGIKIHRDRLKEIGTILENEIDRLEKNIHELAGENFNIKSPKQVGEILFEKLGLKATKKTKTGYSVNSEVLEGLAKDNEIAQKIIDYRHYSKLLSTYVEGLLDIATDDDRVHTSFNQTVTTTGRISSTKPNLQNIPVGEGIAGEIRDAFIPDSPEEFLVGIDYSQVEVRILALMSQDNALLQSFRNNEDIHEKTAEFLGGAERRIAKAVNFGVIYGISGFGLSKGIGTSVKEANEYIKIFYEKYPRIKSFFDEIIAFGEEHGYVQTLFGRKRYLPGLKDHNAIIKKSAQREAINMPIQGTAADIIKLAMIEVDNFLTEKKIKTKMLLQVHDELIFSAPEEELSIMQKDIIDIMEHVLEKYISQAVEGFGIVKNDLIPLKADLSYGKTWKEAK